MQPKCVVSARAGCAFLCMKTLFWMHSLVGNWMFPCLTQLTTGELFCTGVQGKGACQHLAFRFVELERCMAARDDNYSCGVSPKSARWHFAHCTPFTFDGARTTSAKPPYNIQTSSTLREKYILQQAWLDDSVCSMPETWHLRRIWTEIWLYWPRRLIEARTTEFGQSGIHMPSRLAGETFIHRGDRLERQGQASRLHCRVGPGRYSC